MYVYTTATSNLRSALRLLPSLSPSPLPSPQDVIENFNRTVNNWVFRHVYKRLQPLQSRLISQSVSMVFLILWHGLHVGYLINFSLEVPAILAEQKVCRVRGGVGEECGDEGGQEGMKGRGGGRWEG